MAGDGSSKESTLRVTSINGAATLDGMKEMNMPVTFKLSHFNDNEEAETSEDDENA